MTGKRKTKRDAADTTFRHKSPLTELYKVRSSNLRSLEFFTINMTGIV